MSAPAERPDHPETAHARACAREALQDAAEAMREACAMLEHELIDREPEPPRALGWATCPVCGATFKRRTRGQQFCGRACYGVEQTRRARVARAMGQGIGQRRKARWGA